MTTRPLRCAIYTRKSADERADSQLSTLERQRELCAAYIASQAGEGWELLPALYDDGGYTGGNLKRPALTRLLAGVEAGEIDVIVVYKIDRLSRSLRDFVNLVASLEKRGIIFVAITQSFDTRSSTGRLMLNVLLSFAQFERELTSDRLKDWFAGARARGLWKSGMPPYGYNVIDGRLEVNEAQAKVIRYAYRRYPRLGSTRLLAKEINAQGHLNKIGKPFGGHAISSLLSNRLYVGDIVHRGNSLPGKHEAIVSIAAFDRVQGVKAQASQRRAAASKPIAVYPLKGLLYGAEGRRLAYVLVYGRGGRPYVYIAPTVARYRTGDRYRAPGVEGAVIQALIAVAGPPPSEARDVISGWIRRLVARIDLDPERAVLTLTAGAIVVAAHDSCIAKPVTA